MTRQACNIHLLEKGVRKTFKEIIRSKHNARTRTKTRTRTHLFTNIVIL